MRFTLPNPAPLVVLGTNISSYIRLPDAEVDIEAVTRDVAEIASVGAGGLEFLPYYQFRAPSANWSTYGYGTNASRNIFRAAMQAAAENDLLFDFAIGANQGQGVPSEPESVGLALELVSVDFSASYLESRDLHLCLSRVIFMIYGNRK